MKKLLLVLLFVPLVSFGQDAKEYSESGFEKLKLKNYKGALDDLTKAIEINPNDAYNFNYRGQAKEGLEDYNGAIFDINPTSSVRVLLICRDIIL